MPAAIDVGLILILEVITATSAPPLPARLAPAISVRAAALAFLARSARSPAVDVGFVVVASAVVAVTALALGALSAQAILVAVTEFHAMPGFAGAK